MNYYLSRNYRDTNSAGNKAKTDIEDIMADMGFRNAGSPRSFHHGSARAFLATLASVLKTPMNLRRGDILVIQYPLKKYFTLLCRMAHMRGAKVVTLIHDLGSFRRKALSPSHEISRLGNADYIIAHNASMRNWLLEHGLKKPVGELEIFDYLSASEGLSHSSPAPGEAWVVNYAGSLAMRKNAFLYTLGSKLNDTRITLYGYGFSITDAAGADRFDCAGFTPSDRLIATAAGQFGLVWDGNSTAACEGAFGEYLRYNNPHKTSLYLRCNLPVIVWSQSAMAPFVKENGIGLCVDSLDNLDATLAAVTYERYGAMAQAAAAMSHRLASGHYTRRALSEAIRSLQR